MPLEIEFVINPISFPKAHTLSKPDGVPRHALNEWEIQREGRILSGGGGEATSEIQAKNACVVKRDDVTAHSGTQGEYYKDNTTGGMVDRVDSRAPRTGRFGVGTRKIETFLRRTNETTRLVGVGEIYPAKTFSADSTGQITVRA